MTEPAEPAERVEYYAAVVEETRAMLAENVEGDMPEQRTHGNLLRLLADIMDREDAKRGIQGHDLQDDLRAAAQRLDMLDKVSRQALEETLYPRQYSDSY